MGLSKHRFKIGFPAVAIGLSWLFLAIFALIPSFLVLMTSFLVPGDTEFLRLELSLDNYLHLFQSAYLRVFLRSFFMAGLVTLACLCIAYPFCYILANFRVARFKNLMLLLVIVPFWTSSLIRSYAIIAMIKTKGIVNGFLLWLGWIDSPIGMMYTPWAVFIGLVYTLLPLMILPLYVSLDKLDKRLLDAARDLGASKWQIVYKVLLPLTLPGMVSGGILVFLPAMTIFYIPDLLGGAKTMLLGNLIQHQFLVARNWPMGAATSFTLMLLIGLALWLYSRHFKNRQDLFT